jgi:hypothetical protein
MIHNYCLYLIGSHKYDVIPNGSLAATPSRNTKNEENRRVRYNYFSNYVLLLIKMSIRMQKYNIIAISNRVTTRDFLQQN